MQAEVNYVIQFDDLCDIDTPTLVRSSTVNNIDIGIQMSDPLNGLLSRFIFKESECPVCLQTINMVDCVPLRCGHVLCDTDIINMINNKYLCCPICRRIQEVDSISQLKFLRESGTK